MRRPTFLVPPLFGVAVVSLAGCGGGPSKQDFLAKADAACKRGNAVSSVLTTPIDVPGLKEFGIKLADNVDKTTAELDKLKLPGGDDGDDAKAVVKAMREAATAARAIGPAVDKDHYTDIETAARATVDAFKAADAQARAYGSTECGKGEAESTGRMATALGTAVKSAFIVKADALCSATVNELKALGTPQTKQETLAYFDKAIAIEEKLIADVKALPAPVTDKDKLAAWLASFDAVVTKARESRTAAAAGDNDKYAVLREESGKRTLTAAGKASAYGLKACGTESS